MDNPDEVDLCQITIWEKYFPGRGMAMVEMMKPFIERAPTVGPALPDLERRAKTAITWTQVRGVQVFRESQHAVLNGLTRCSLGASLRNLHKDSFEVSKFYAAFGSVSRVTEFDKASLEMWSRTYPGIWGKLGDSLWTTVVFVCVLSLLLDRPATAAKLQPLLGLWLAGNFPIGFDEDNDLLVLVAD